MQKQLTYRHRGIHIARAARAALMAALMEGFGDDAQMARVVAAAQLLYRCAWRANVTLCCRGDSAGMTEISKA